ncbi:DUF4012 domain-containing protein [Isoptericola jiangsuensis]|uniref:DUF4012 domain-containing protein n=1 Tax=Isoptericola jiangsuensis TaxID=548579 RepID=UPI003AAE4570
MPLAPQDASAPTGTADASPAATRRRRTVRWILLGVVAVAVVVAVCAGLLVRDAFAARDALERAAAEIPAVQESLRESLDDPAQDSPLLADDPALASLQKSTAEARAATDGPLWWLAARLPVVGQSVGAATTMSRVIDEVADVVVPALAMTADAARLTTRADDGTIDLAAIAEVAPEVSAARDVLAGSRTSLSQIDPTAIQPVFVEPVITLDAQLASLDGLLASAERATSLLPPMLGADAPRRYLLLGLTNAELRTGGGITGSLMELEVDGGRVGVGTQASSGDVGPFAPGTIALDPQDEAAYTDRLGRFVQDVTLTPDFPTTAGVAVQMWQESHGVEVDGVLATDPVALSYLLAATGPVTVDLPPRLAALVGTDELEVQAETVVDLLLRRAYDVLDAQQSDRFFALVAATVFEALSTSDVTPADLLPALERAAAEHRLGVWSATPAEQDLLDSTLLAGTFGDDRAADAVGVFLDDAVVGKLSAYLDTAVELQGSVCTGEGRTDTVALSLTNTLDDAAAADLPTYVAGPVDAPDRGRMTYVVSAYGPRDGATPRLSQDGAATGGDTTGVHGRQRVAVTVVLDPGESTVLQVEVPASAAAARGTGSARPATVEVWSTPTSTSAGLHVLDVPFCG